MKVFIAGAVTAANENQLKKYNVYKKILMNVFGEISLTTPDDIWDFRNKCIKENPKAQKIEIDKMMTDFDLQKIRESDLIVCDLTVSSTGMGIELGVAHENRNKVVFCFEGGSNVSNMITGTFSSSKFVSYKNLRELEKELVEALKGL